VRAASAAGPKTPDQPNSGAWGDTLNRMRIPTSDGAGQRGIRRRGRGAATPGSDRDTARPDADRASGGHDAGRRHAAGHHADSNRAGSSGLGTPGSGTRPTSAQYAAGPASGGSIGPSGAAAASSVFAPGYDGSQARGDAAPPRGGMHGPPLSYGSTGGGGAGKGPVRGFPPAPGQPPPIYPPGQFSAWNVGQDSRSRPGSQDRSQPDRGFPGRPGYDGSQPDQAGRQSGQPAAGSQYYDSSGTDPGYSMLAVSDPAADVTSTQTWRAVGDGRSTGTWTAPARPGAGPGGQPGSPRAASGRHSVPPGPVRPGQASPGTASLDPGRPGRAAPDTDRRGHSSRDSHNQDGHQRPSAGQSGVHSGSHTSERGPQAEPRPTRAKSPASGKRSASKKRPASVKLAISVAMLLVLAAAATLGYTVLRTVPKPKPASATGPTQQPTVSPSASPSPSLGRYGHIASRKSDPQPLTIAQLFPARFTSSGQTVTRTASIISRHCGAAVSGSSLQSAVGSAKCDQEVRATYLARAKGLMGTVGVLNLGTAARAAKAVKAADASDFVSQLKGKRGPTHRIGNGTGIEEALAKGHYLILIWAEFTSLHRPRTAAQRTKVENFMTELLQNTANVSLATRMLTGSP
jgi:hypothetical protein